jgi:AraC-like DNA-binding protein
MVHQEFEPPEALRDTIKCFWYNEKEFGPEPTAFEVIPDGYAEIIFYFGDGLSLAADENMLSLPSPFMMGLLNRPVVFHTKNRFEVIGVRCFPWTVFDLLGLPSGKSKVHILKHPVTRLQPALHGLLAAGDIAGAIACAAQYFVDARSNIAVNSMLSKAGSAMSKARGTLPVSRVAAAAHATVRTLERNFKQSSGHTVKDVSALIRFEQVRNRLWHQPDVNLAGLAQETGYTDQSHLSREFKRYSGTTPAAFIRKAKNDQLTTSNDFVAFVQD